MSLCKRLGWVSKHSRTIGLVSLTCDTHEYNGDDVELLVFRCTGAQGTSRFDLGSVSQAWMLQAKKVLRSAGWPP